MPVLTVGSGQQYSTVAGAIAASQSGDTINVQAGTYTNDFTNIDHSLTLQAVGGMVTMAATVQPPNGKAILTEGASGIDVKIDGFAFTGARVADQNGAGIRYQGGSLTVTNSNFFNNQDGILGNADANGVISISHSEFSNNGIGGDGYAHNMYISDIKSFVLTDSFTHDTTLGHEIKSRAENNTITNNRIFDNNSTSSYEIDLPNGGNATISGNAIEQGQNSQNPNIIAYGEEGNLHAGSSLSITGNTIVNDKGTGPALWNASGTVAAFTNNSVYGFNGVALVNGPATQRGTTVLSSRPTLDQSAPYPSTPTPLTPIPTPTPAPTPVPTPTTGPDQLVVNVSEDAYLGDAQFTVSVDGVQQGGVQTATASHSAGATQAVTFNGVFGTGPHSVGVSFINDAWGGTANTDRNLYVDKVAFDGNAVTGGSATLDSNSTTTFTVKAAPAPIPTPTPAPAPVAVPTPVAVPVPAPTTTSDTLVVNVSEDAYLGDAQFTVSVDGVQQGGTQTATASHGASAQQAFIFAGNFGAGPHTVAVSFINDQWDGTPSTDRNLYVDNIAFDGQQIAAGNASLYRNGTANFTVASTTAPVPAPTAAPVVPPTPILVPLSIGTPDTLVVNVSEDAYLGDAQFTVTVDGVQQGGTHTATASHQTGAIQAVSFTGNFGSGPHTVGVSFINDKWDGTPSTDRNLYVDKVAFDGQTVTGSSATLNSNGTATFTVGASLVSNTAPTPTTIPVVAPTPVATPTPVSAPATGAYTLEGAAWATHSITWSFATSTYAKDASNPFSVPIETAYQATIQQAMQRWASVSGLSLVQQADSTDPTQSADIRIGFGDLNTPTSHVVGYTNYQYGSTSTGGSFMPDTVVRLEDPSQDALNSGLSGLTYQGFSATLYQTALHEIGHALGLGHSTEATAIMYPTLGSSDPDLSSSDIAGIQALYGAPPSASSQMVATAAPATATLSPESATSADPLATIIASTNILSQSTPVTFLPGPDTSLHSASASQPGANGGPAITFSQMVDGSMKLSVTDLFGGSSANFPIETTPQLPAFVSLTSGDYSLGQALAILHHA